MQRTRRRDTDAEQMIRRQVHRLGLRYRMNTAPLLDIQRRTNILFVSARVAVFVDGCFWHGCPEHATWPRANAAWWREKLLANRKRDRDTDRLLRSAGWLVLRFWEHEDPASAARKIGLVVKKRRRAKQRSS